MYTSVPTEFQFFLLSIVSGIVSAFLYDILRISRRIVRVSDAVINIEDILFFIAAAFLIFVAAYLKNSGELRWQSFIGFATGICIYIFTVKNRLLNISTIIIRFIVRITGAVLSVILFPLRLIFKIFRKPVSVIAWYTGMGVRRVKSAAKSKGIKARITAKNLFRMFSGHKQK